MRYLVITVTIVLCHAFASAGQTLQPEQWDATVKLREAVDLNPDPHVVEINLRAEVAPVDIAPDIRSQLWTYNGGLPGPLIRARRRRSADRALFERVAAADHRPLAWCAGAYSDGRRARRVAGPRDTGGSFTYDFVVPDAGLFWYHPHVMSAAQVGFGLYGALLVEAAKTRCMRRRARDGVQRRRDRQRDARAAGQWRGAGRSART